MRYTGKPSAPVLVELMNAPSLRRLRGISQIGYCGPFFTFDFSRFSHSVGVCVLLQRHGASIEEQIAVSYMTFPICLSRTALITRCAIPNPHMRRIFMILFSRTSYRERKFPVFSDRTATIRRLSSLFLLSHFWKKIRLICAPTGLTTFCDSSTSIGQSDTGTAVP